MSKNYKEIMNDVVDLLKEAAIESRIVILVEETQQGVIFGSPDFINAVVNGDDSGMVVGGFRAYGMAAVLEELETPEGNVDLDEKSFDDAPPAKGKTVIH